MLLNSLIGDFRLPELPMPKISDSSTPNSGASSKSSPSLSLIMWISEDWVTHTTSQIMNGAWRNEADSELLCPSQLALAGTSLLGLCASHFLFLFPTATLMTSWLWIYSQRISPLEANVSVDGKMDRVCLCACTVGR